MLAPIRSGLFIYMKKIELATVCTKLPADIFTPVSIYLRLRDRFRDTILLESTDHHVAENSFSFICINAIGGVEIINESTAEVKIPGFPAEKKQIKAQSQVIELLNEFLGRFNTNQDGREASFAQGLYGYCAYDAIPLFEAIGLNKKATEPIAPLRYRLYQYVIAINHYKDELMICENRTMGVESEIELVESLIRSKDVPSYPFSSSGNETSALSDEDYMEMVKKGIGHCHRGDVFQIVLSRKFEQTFKGDEFNVYRALRTVNPSPYLFFFDYGDYKLMGSSPESQVIVSKGKATVHPIAGTFRRTGNDDDDQTAAELLLKDKKENAEHVMLVDLARNDLSRVCDDVKVAHYKEIQYYSHVIHMVSEVTGKVKKGKTPFDLLANTFPAGTLSGAPKFRAMELIDQFEKYGRGYYGGTIGFVGMDGSCNHAIMIRTILSLNNTLFYQAGAGIVAGSDPAKELEEVNNKLGALKKAIEIAETFV